ncbi:MAG: PilZ domain-containing protein [Oleiphilaceae bacterium]|nr:PilZ domain-containing protein [Oleiphilaceae bacterium]
MKDYSEKRDFHRMRVNSEIQITRSDGRVLAGICRDLSATGMQLYVEEPIEAGEELVTLILSNDDNFPPFESSVRVLRSEAEGSGFLLGTAIIEVKR